MRKLRFAVVVTLTVLLVGVVQVSAQLSNPNTSIVSIGSPGAQWTYIHSSPIASKLIIEFGGGRVAYNPYSGYTLFVTLLDSHGVGGLYAANQIDELILLTYPRYFDLIFGEYLSVQFDLWLNEAVAWAWAHNYTSVYGYGYSAGSTVWMRYALSDEFGHVRPSNETVTGIIEKAYPNQSCVECFMNAKNISLPILFLSGTEDTVAPIAGVQQFYGMISSPTKSLITFPTDHNGMADILPTTEQTWLIQGATAVPETSNSTVFVISVFLLMPICIALNKRRRR